MKLVLLMPTWNEGWILDSTLRINAKLFDHILILDQISIDDTREIARKYVNVTLIDNFNPKFNEGERQLSLIAHARNLFGHSALFALDSDEILVGITREELLIHINELSPGTTIFLPWVNPIAVTGESIVVRKKIFGFIDDGTRHKPNTIHSERLPLGSNTTLLQQGYVLHLQYLNYERNKFKHLWYMHYEYNNLNRGIFYLLTTYTQQFIDGKYLATNKYQFSDELFTLFKKINSVEDTVWKKRLETDFPVLNEFLEQIYLSFISKKKLHLKYRIVKYLSGIKGHLAAWWKWFQIRMYK